MKTHIPGKWSKLAVVLLWMGGAAKALAGTWYCSPSDLFPLSDGIYDEQGKAFNQVDTEAQGNTKSLATFKEDVATAHLNNRGTVIGFEHGRGKTDHLYSLERSGGGHACNWLWPQGDSDYPGPTRLWYGKDYIADSVPHGNDGNGQYIEVHTGPNQVVDFYNFDWGLGTAISGDLLWWDTNLGRLVEQTGRQGIMGTHDANHYGNIDGMHTVLTISSQKEIAELGITALSKGDVMQNLSVTVHFGDGTSITQTEVISAGVGTDDTFFHFAAPSKTGIVGLEWQSDQKRPQFDDLAFIFRIRKPTGMVLSVH